MKRTLKLLVKDFSIYLSAVSPSVHTNPSRECGFLKALRKTKEFKNAGFGFQCGKKTFENESSKTIKLR